MQMRTLGSQGPEISVIGYGAWGAGGMGWGENPPDSQVIESVRAGIDAGMNWIDTAEVYGGGRSEELMGEAVQGYDDVMVFTKVASAGAGSGYSKEGVRAGAEGSLKRLGRDVIDLYQIHWPSREVDIQETWSAMASLVDDGLVRYIGVSNFSRSLIEKCEAIRHVDSLQPHFSMLSQDGRDDLFPFCDGNGTGIIAYGPLAYGLLAGAFDKSTTFSDDDWRSGKHGIGYYDELFAPGVFEKRIDQVDAVLPIADRLGVSPPQLALAWVLHQRGVTGAIAGSRKPDHVRANASAGEISLANEILSDLDQALGSSGP